MMMTTANVHDFTVRDADGNDVHYRTAPHPTSEGMDITFRLLAVGAPTVVDAIIQLLGAVDAEQFQRIRASFKSKPQGEDGDDQDAGGLGAAFLDSATTENLQMGPAVERLVSKLAANNEGRKLIRDILRYSRRGDQDLAGDGAFEAAYARNYLEAVKAVWEVVRYNRFLPLDAISGMLPGVRVRGVTQS